MGSRFPRDIAVYTLRPFELNAIESLLHFLVGTYESAEDPDFIAEARRIGFSSLPIELLRRLDQFYRTEFATALAVVGFRVVDRRIGPTPLHWNMQRDRRSTLR